jgi:hypothetical protein
MKTKSELRVILFTRAFANRSKRISNKKVKIDVLHKIAAEAGFVFG